MKTRNIKLATFGFAAMLLASCSDSNDTPTPTPNPAETGIIGKEVTSITDAQQLAARVYNFKRPSATRAAGVTSADLNQAYTMEAEPTGLDFAKMEKMSNYKPYNLPANTDMYIAPGETIAFNQNYHLNGNTIYVAGTYECNSTWTEGNYTIVVLKGGTLKWTGGNIFPNQNGGKILCYGNFECNADLEVHNRGIFKIAGDLNLKGHTFKVNNASVYIGGKLICNEFKNQANAYTNIQGGIEGIEDKPVELDGVVNIDGNCKMKDLILQGSGQLFCCSLELTGEFKSTGGDGQGSALHTSYLKAKNLLLASSNNIYLVNNSSIEVEGTLQCNKNASAMIFLQGANSKAYIKANVIKYNGSGSPASLMDCYMFNAMDTGGEFYIDADHFDNDDSGNLAFSDIQFLGSGKVHNFRNNSAPVTLVKAECGYTLNPDVPTPPHIDEVGEVLYDHTHTDITATCIQPYNGKLYMSYHTRGKGHGGCIEVFETDNQKQTKLLQFLQDTDKSLDFNHLMVDGKSSTPNLYVVGNYGYTNKNTGKQSDAGAMMARIDLKSNGLLNTEVKNIGDAAINPLIIVPLENNQSNNEDENAIVRDGDKLLVTSTRGYEVYDPNTLELLSNKKTPGKAKHIALNNGEIATLYYNDEVNSAETPVAGTLEIFNAGDDITTVTPQKSIAVSEIAPNNGKNTIAIDGNNVYVCRSANGLTCYDKNTGAEKWTWQAPLTASTFKPQGYANGVTFDDKYVYLACGGYGLVVLDKNKMVDGKPAVYAKTRVTGITNEQGRVVWNSANYVTLYNGLIYVAYGKNRLKVYQLVDGATSGSNTGYGTK
ncbi:PQQ-like beta-propeller repeat protein [Segatella copri]|uniref:PQQ-like beta-propeller repeat protein n=1 Tax=Segatella copri TaxID=165179 RepID=UPI001C45A0AE|nr:PQQ-like beta-propeller repeat protein [Segatella copri]WOZ83889.1 PQQ-like beta-propeller repeat protein [Segatella copri]